MSPIKRSKKLHGSKKMSRKKSSENSAPSNEKDYNLGDLLKRKWKVFRVSPFYNFAIDKFRFYEKKLNEGLNSRKKTTYTYKSRLTVMDNLRLNKNCAEGVQVKVMKDDSQGTYVGYFISWSAKKDMGDGSVSLPILLVDAKADETHAVHQTLCKIFDCEIQPVTFSLHALITFFGKLLETPRISSDASSDHVIIEYKVPECEAKDRIKICFSLEDTKVVFAVVMDSLYEKFKGITIKEILSEFYNKILNHIYHVYKMDLILAEMQKIIFPDAFITADGQIKMATDEVAKSALNVLEEFTPLDAIIDTYKGDHH